MTDHATPPRMPPLPEDERSPEQAEMLSVLGEMTGMNIFGTLVRHPTLYRRWAAFAGQLLQRSSFDPHDREIVILRVAWRTNAPYEWGAHVGIGRQAGLTDAEILSTRDPRGAPESDALLMRAVDELHDAHVISDETWAKLAARYDEQQLIELPMLAGQYIMLAGVLNSLRVPGEVGYPGFGEVG